jgi:hypothetical protein
MVSSFRLELSTASVVSSFRLGLSTASAILSDRLALSLGSSCCNDEFAAPYVPCDGQKTLLPFARLGIRGVIRSYNGKPLSVYWALPGCFYQD